VPSNKCEALRQELNNVFAKLEPLYAEHAGRVVTPELDMYPQDYLYAAEQRLENHDKAARIECVANLKRAMDSAVHCFLYTYGLDRHFRDQKAGLTKKLSFLDAIEVVSSSRLNKLVALRNRVEHLYKIPEKQEIHFQAYYELVSAFVNILERTALLARRTELVFGYAPFPEPYEACASYVYETPRELRETERHERQSRRNTRQFLRELESRGTVTPQELEAMEREFPSVPENPCLLFAQQGPPSKFQAALREWKEHLRKYAETPVKRREPHAPVIRFEFERPDGRLRLEASTDEMDDFTEFMRVFILLSEFMAGANRATIISRLEGKKL